MGSLLQVMLPTGVRLVFGGKDGLKYGQLYHYFHQMEQLILDKIFR